MECLRKKTSLFFKLSSILVLLCVTGCKKWAEVEAPFTSANAGTVYTDNTRAISVLTGLYMSMSSGSAFTGSSSISFYSGLSADELTLYNSVSDTRLIAYFQNALVASPSSSIGSEFWSPIYNYIFVCNAAIEGLEHSPGLSTAVKSQLLGEAKFMRSFFYFYLTNLFGDVPVALTTDYKMNASLARSEKSKVYNQIIADLKDAENLLSVNYLDANLQPYSAGSIERVRPTKWAATSLLARVLLYTGDYAGAAAKATSVINNTQLFFLTDLKDVFQKNSFEAIWQLQPVQSGQNTLDALTFLLPSTGPDDYQYPVYLSSSLVGSFEGGDQRRYNQNWIDSVIIGSDTFYYPTKYKTGYSNVETISDLAEYQMVFRLGELYLVRAEAQAQLNKIGEAQSDLNAIRRRAGLSNIYLSDKNTLITAILHERQDELFTEYGHRWFDLKRTNNIDEIMNVVVPLKVPGTSWKTYQQLYPLPWSELEKDPNLIQNLGY